MKSFWTSLAVTFFGLLIYGLFFGAKKVDIPTPEPPQKIEVKPVVLTLIQQNSAPNYQIVFDSIPAVAPEGWRVIGSGRSGDVVTVE